MPIERYGDDAARRRAQAAAEAAGRDVKESARAAGREGAQRARGFLDHQRDLAAERVHGLADALRRTSLDLDDDGASDLTARCADGVERLSEALRDRDVDVLKRDAEDFGRRHPGAMFGGAFAAGLVLSRFLKSSSAPERASERGAPFGAGVEDDLVDDNLEDEEPEVSEYDVPRPSSVTSAVHVTEPSADLPAHDDPETPRSWR